MKAKFGAMMLGGSSDEEEEEDEEEESDMLQNEFTTHKRRYIATFTHMSLVWCHCLILQ